MSIYITKDGEKRKVNISATDVQLLDIDGRFKSNNLEDALKEVGSGTEENMTRIEEKVIEHTAQLEELDNNKANSSHTHDDRYYTESEINDKLNDKVNLTKSNDYDFNEGEAKNNIRRIEVNGNTLTNSPNGNNGGVVFEFVGSHGRWNTQQYNDQQGRMWYRTSYDYDGSSTKWNSWKEVSLNEKTVNPQLLNGWQYWSDANHGQIFAKNGDFGYVSLTVQKSVSNDNTIIANTPYRPEKRIIACVSAGATTMLECRIEPNGDIRLNGEGYKADGWVAINICYPLKF